MDKANTAQNLLHAYIIAGNDDELVKKITMQFLCGSSEELRPCGKCSHCEKVRRELHPDVAVIAPAAQGREIVVSQIRELKKDALIIPNEATRKVYIIKNADSMNPAAQNAILKLLEEPPDHVAFLLQCENPVLLLETVRSRCVIISADHNSDSPVTTSTVSDFFNALDENNLLMLCEFSYKLDKLERHELSEFISGARKECVRRMSELAVTCSAETAQLLTRILTALETADLYYSRNVSAVHISGLLLAECVTAV